MSDPVVATFNPGDAEATVIIPLINDGVDEDTEFFGLVLTLGNNTNIEGRSCVTLGMENTGIIGTILDDGMYIKTHVVSRKAKKKQHARASSSLRDYYSELFTRSRALKFVKAVTKRP